ncbi:MAG: hypothetical protein RQ715_05590 [Methylococcales bacterium]|nr:hypothetical protein [Methylococcales bacterium]
MSNHLQLQQITGQRDLDRFIDVPWQLYRDDPNWRPPLKLMEKERLTPAANPYFEHAETAFWLALRDGVPVGRISAQIDHLALQQPDHRHCGHFGFIEAIDEAEVWQTLLTQAERWLKDKGMKRIMGPFNLSINQECGVLVKGFDHPPNLMMGHALPYYAGQLEAAGYAKIKDLIAYNLDVTRPFPSPIQKLLRRARRLDALVVRPVNLKRFDDDMRLMFDIFNDAWADNWGFVPWTEAEIQQTAKEMKPLIRPEINWIAEYQGEPIGFMAALPNLNEAIADLDGRLLPFGWAKLLWRLKLRGRLTATNRVPLMGIRKRFQGRPLGAYAAFLLIETIRHNGTAIGAQTAELSWMLEDNTALQDILEGIHADPYKKYRLYSKSLS